MRLPKDYWILWTGGGLSLLGSYMQYIALPLWVLDVTGSPVATGSAFAMSVLPTVLLAPVAGYLADRVDRRILTIVCEAVSGVAVLVLLLSTEHASVIGVYIGAFAVRTFNTATVPATQAMIRAKVPEDLLPRASARFDLVNSVAIIAGPALGSAVYAAAGIEWVLYANLASFLVSAGLTAAVSPCPGARSQRGIATATLSALGHVMRSARLAPVALTEGVYYLFIGGSTALCVILASSGLGDALSGLYVAGMGAGWLLTSTVILTRFGGRAAEVVRVAGLCAVPVAVLQWVAVGWNPVTCFVCGMVAGMANLAVAGGASIVYQAETDKDNAGRIFAMRRALINACLGVSTIGLPALGVALGIGQVLLIMAVIATVGTAGVRLMRPRLAVPAEESRA
ncbi:MFS transporter [Streptosporangium sandarakinum]|uniref:MFS family permease n=1 Tax=Streptosporangium sandarakinum TaxID=1260955 RepID=A0A852VB16_9ACTN|nr:MFS transporter [Streptosporangium sandarakinum]NYF44433.1 MFS family permease [Streptosporangium sandarakinum]